jgi:small neutral amino acid transporter SnatA (MarC family)
MVVKRRKIFRSRISVLFIVFIFAIFLRVFILLFQEKAYQDIYILGGILLFVILLSTGMRYVISGNSKKIAD